MSNVSAGDDDDDGSFSSGEEVQQQKQVLQSNSTASASNTTGSQRADNKKKRNLPGTPDAIVILLLIALSTSIIFLLLLLLFHSYLILTNQTTYELVRCRRIPYLRGIPERVFPFYKGICRNLYFCCFVAAFTVWNLFFSTQELEEKSRAYTCLDVLSCRSS